jgi:hypothetical protein
VRPSSPPPRRRGAQPQCVLPDCQRQAAGVAHPRQRGAHRWVEIDVGGACRDDVAVIRSGQEVGPDVGAAAGGKASEAQHPATGGDNRVGQGNQVRERIGWCEKARANDQVDGRQQFGRQPRRLQLAFEEIGVGVRRSRRRQLQMLPPSLPNEDGARYR